MKLHRPGVLILTFVVLLSLLGCGPLQPKPITNPSSVETSLASTARALAKQTETANGYTATPSVVPTETLTPTPKISLQGTSLVIREDQSTLFIDHKLGYQLVIPAGWLVTRLNEPEYYRAFTLDDVLENPAINDRLTKLQNDDAEHLRVNAIDTRPGHIVKGMICDITVLLQFDQLDTLEEWSKNKGKHADILVGYQRTSTNFQETANGTRVLVIEEQWNYTDTDKLYLKRFYFKLATGIVTIDLQTNLEFKDNILPEFQAMVDSLTLLNP